MTPDQEKTPLLDRLLTGQVSAKTENCISVCQRHQATSAWTYAHELGRLHLEQTFPEEVTTMNAMKISLKTWQTKPLRMPSEKDCNIVFTTTPEFVQASVQAAISTIRMYGF